MIQTISTIAARFIPAAVQECRVDRSRKTTGWKPGRSWDNARSGEEDYAFILRVRVSVASDGGERRPQFSIEDVSAGRTERFATFEHATESLANSVERIVSGPVGDKAHS